MKIPTFQGTQVLGVQATSTLLSQWRRRDRSSYKFQAMASSDRGLARRLFHWMSWSGLVSFIWLVSQWQSLCWGQVAPGTWTGTGQIIDGYGQGALVQIVVEIRNGTIKTKSGPPLSAPYVGGFQEIKTESGVWHIEPQGDQILMILHHDDRRIRYQLIREPSFERAPSAPRPSPLSHGPAPNPLSPEMKDIIVIPVQHKR